MRVMKNHPTACGCRVIFLFIRLGKGSQVMEESCRGNRVMVGSRREVLHCCCQLRHCSHQGDNILRRCMLATNCWGECSLVFRRNSVAGKAGRGAAGDMVAARTVALATVESRAVLENTAADRVERERGDADARVGARAVAGAAGSNRACNNYVAARFSANSCLDGSGSCKCNCLCSRSEDEISLTWQGPFVIALRLR